MRTIPGYFIATALVALAVSASPASAQSAQTPVVLAVQNHTTCRATLTTREQHTSAVQITRVESLNDRAVTLKGFRPSALAAVEVTTRECPTAARYTLPTITLRDTMYVVLQSDPALSSVSPIKP